jgi:hypothetical protein
MFDRKFLKKSHSTIRQIREVGKYDGDIVCIIADDLKDCQSLLYKDSRIIVKHFKQYDTAPILNDAKKVPADEGKREIARVCFPMKAKMIHYHKFYCFHTYFRDNYKKCFYIDTNTQIFKPLDKIINLDCTGKILAHLFGRPELLD